MKPIPLGKKTGVLIHYDDKFYFRVYTSNDFTDYEIWHSDLGVTIEDDDAYVYEEDGRLVINHSPKTLFQED